MRVLIAIAGDEHSKEVLEVGAGVVQTTQAALTMMTVVEHERDQAAANAMLNTAAATIRPPAKLATRTAIGDVVTEIVREARNGDYDLLIIGARTTYPFLKRLLGHTSDHIVAHAPCPVLVVKGEARPPTKILVCSGRIDGLAEPGWTRPGLAPIFSGKAITLLHVMSQISATPDTAEGWQLRADAEKLIVEETPEGRLLEEHIKLLQSSGFQVSPKVRHGLVVDEILAESLSGNYDLVVIGAHIATGWERLLLDDVAHQIIAQIDRPVLIV